MKYNLRPRKDNLPEEEVRPKREATSLPNPRKKLQRTADPFDPSQFKQGSGYDNLCDSEDSGEEDDSSNDDFSNGEFNSSMDEFSDASSEDTEYFELHPRSLVEMVTKRLRERFPDLSETELKAAVENALEKAGDLAEEYSGTVPKDISWKVGLEDDQIEILEPELKQLRHNIEENTPTIPKILQSGLATIEKERALQLYDALQNVEPFTLEYMELSAKLSMMIRTAPCNLDPAVNQDLQLLQAKLEQKMPTVEKITAARIPESEKLRALQLYQILQQTPDNSDIWFSLQTRINTILEAQFSSVEEVTQIEQEETALKMKTFNFHADLKRQIFELDADDEVKGRIYELYSDMITRGVDDSRYDSLRDKIVWALRLPYRRRIPSRLGTSTPEEIRIYCQSVYAQLNTEIYGMQEAKERIIQTVNDQIRNPNSRNILALKGKPGVGKTKLAKTIAKAVGRPFDKISLGGAVDSTIFKGSENVWIGSTPSAILQILARAKYSNAVILLDEIDKLGVSQKGLEVQHALLHILDPTQNQEVKDSYLSEFSHDFSGIWFICALNDDATLDPALRDRLNIIKVPSYSKREMIEIMTRHTLPEALADKGLPTDAITLHEDGAQTLLHMLGTEIEKSGMRQVEREVNDLVSKINLLQSLGCKSSIQLSYKLPDFQGFPYTITSSTVRELMTPKKSDHQFMYL